MQIATNKIIDEALSLPADARVDLVEKLLTSLNLPTRPQIERLWAEEAEKRVAQIESGYVKMIPAARVFSQIRKKHGK